MQAKSNILRNNQWVNKEIRGKKYLETNGNGSTIVQDVGDTTHKQF